MTEATELNTSEELMGLLERESERQSKFHCDCQVKLVNKFYKN